MKRTNKVWLMIALVMLAATATAFAQKSTYGAGTAVQAIADGSQFTVTDMLRWAAEDEYLARPEPTDPANASVKTLFGQLMRASENHLRSFRNQLARF